MSVISTKRAWKETDISLTTYFCNIDLSLSYTLSKMTPTMIHLHDSRLGSMA